MCVISVRQVGDGLRRALEAHQVSSCVLLLLQQPTQKSHTAHAVLGGACYNSPNSPDRPHLSRADSSPSSHLLELAL